MSILKQILSLLVVIDPNYYYLATLAATFRHVQLVQQSLRLYRHRFGRELNWKKPTRFSEKIHLFKLSQQAEEVSMFADKYTVREFVTTHIGSEYLIPLLGVYTSTEEIPLKALPNSFVLKCTHGSGWNIICENKNNFDWSAEAPKLNSWLTENFYYRFAERQYRTIQPRIVCEEYLGTTDGLTDYKFHCFHGHPEFIRVMSDRKSGIKKSTYSMDWKPISFTYVDVTKTTAETTTTPLPKPRNFQEMVDVAKKLSKPFPYVRVDLYNLNGKIYFGELTFTPNAGLDVHSPDEMDEVYGAKI